MAMTPVDNPFDTRCAHPDVEYRRRSAWLAVCVLALLPAVATAQGFANFDDFLSRYRASERTSRPVLAKSFVEWQRAHGGFPIIGADGSVVFVYVGSGDEIDVRLTGDFYPGSFGNVYWDAAGRAMEHVGSIFYSRRVFELDARLDYAF